MENRDIGKALVGKGGGMCPCLLQALNPTVLHTTFNYGYTLVSHEKPLLSPFIISSIFGTIQSVIRSSGPHPGLIHQPLSPSED